MRASASEIIAALVDTRQRGLVPFRFVTLWPTSRDTGEAEPFCFWSEPVPAAVPIANRITGDLETRDFVGGAVLSWGKVKLVTGLTIQPWSVAFNALHPAVLDMVTNYELRRALVECHRVPASTVSRRKVADPARRFLGRVDTAPRPIPGVNEESSIEIACSSSTVQLTMTNPTRRSDVAQKRRSGDRQMQYVDVAADWDIPWGEATGGVK